ncbi:hypothetical protein [Thiomicrospira sp.]
MESLLFQAALVLSGATGIFSWAVYLSLKNKKRAKKEKEVKEAFSC